MIFGCHKDLFDGKEATVSLLDWKSWKLKRVGRSSLSAECQAMEESLDMQNYMRTCLEILVGRAPQGQRINQDDTLAKSPVSCLITDCKGLFDVVNRSQSSGLGLAEKEQPLEALSIRQIIGG